MVDKLIKEPAGLKDLPSLGEGKNLFAALDKHHQSENMSPWLASSLHKFMVAAEQHQPGQLQELAIRGRGGLKFALTQLEPELLETLRALEANGETEGKKADELMVEYLQWMHSDEEV